MENNKPSVFTVSSLTKEIQDLLQAKYDWVQVRGEISNLKPAASGHVYFSLKDHQAVISCVAWRSTAARWSGLNLKDGMEVFAGGSISLYPPRGQYQLVVTSLRLEGEGALQVRFDALKRLLFEEGIFDEAHKKPLPYLPRKIAVITSPTGAALQDFLRVLYQRNCPAEVMICPVLVQGNEAADQITRMIEQVNQAQSADCIVLTRGGGSLEDLWAFNEEKTARAVYHSDIPVISAVGHEVDYTITDFAADFRAPTPTGAAQALSQIYIEHQSRLYQYVDQLRRSILPVLEQEKERLTATRRVLYRYHPQTITSLHKQRLDEWLQRLTQRMKERMANEKRSLQIQQSSLTRTISFKIQQEKERAAQLRRLLDSHALQKTLARGYAICRDVKGKIITDARMLKPDDAISVRTAKGSMSANITRVEPS